LVEPSISSRKLNFKAASLTNAEKVIYTIQVLP